MTDARTPSQTGTLPPADLRRVLAVLCLTELASWGVLYYAFPVLSVSISNDTGWSPQTIMAAFSIGQLIAALTGIPVGRIIDRIGPRAVMTAGSVLAVPGLVLVAVAQNLPTFYAGWFIAGIAMGAVLYPPAFAAVTRWYGERYVKALTVLTLVAGLASTVFAPLAATLGERTDWRTAYLILAGMLAAITIPAHLWGLRGTWPQPPAPTHSDVVNHRDASRSCAFISLVVALSLAAFVAFAGVFNLVPLLIEQGFSPSLAAMILGLSGAGQLLGRIGYPLLQARTSVRGRSIGVLVCIALSTALLGITTTVAMSIMVAIGAGLARGLFTLVQATAITDRWGSTHYGWLNGLMSAPIVTVMALAPWAGSALSSWTGSYSSAYLVLGAIAVLAAVVAAVSVPCHVRTPKPAAP